MIRKYCKHDGPMTGCSLCAAEMKDLMGQVEALSERMGELNVSCEEMVKMGNRHARKPLPEKPAETLNSEERRLLGKALSKEAGDAICEAMLLFNTWSDQDERAFSRRMDRVRHLIDRASELCVRPECRR